MNINKYKKNLISNEIGLNFEIVLFTGQRKRNEKN